MIELDAKTQTVLWIGIGVYIAVMLGIGYLSGRKVKDMNDFLVLYLASGEIPDAR